MRLILISFSSAVIAASAPAADSNRAENTVILNETAIRNLGLETVEALETEFEETVFALGRIRVAPGHSAVVSSRVHGRAVSVSAHIDMFIEKGAEAVVIESRQPGDPPPRISLPAPISGYVSAVNIAVGQPVSPDDSLIEILDLTSVHAIAALPEHLAGKVGIGKRGRIRPAGYPDREFEAEVEHVGAEADEETGTIEVAFHVENPESLLRPGMRAEFSIVTNRRENVMNIPRDAVQGDAAQRFVYIADYELENAFVKIPVVLGAQNDRMVEVISGLLPGDEVVTRGAYALAFTGRGNVSLKEALDAAHGHPHAEDGSELTEEARQAMGEDGDHGHDHRWTSLTIFFATTTGLLSVLTIVLGTRLRRRHAA